MLINIIKVLFLHAARLIIPRLPLRAIYRIADVTGNIMVGDKSSIMSYELRRLFGDTLNSELHSIKQRAMKNFRKDLFEIWIFPRLNQRQIDRIVCIKGLEHLDEAVEKGRGVILCQTHFGSYKLVSAVLGYKGYKVNQLAVNPMVFARDRVGYYQKQIMKTELESELSLPAKLIYLDSKEYVIKICRALASNELLVVALDGVVGKRHMTLPFLNHRILLSTAVVSLSLTSGAPALPVFVVRGKNDRHQITIHKPFNIKMGRDKESYSNQWMINYAELFEQYVGSRPDHYARFLYTLRKHPASQIENMLEGH